MINLPEPPETDLDQVNFTFPHDMAIFSLPELTEDSYLIQWEIYIHTRPKRSIVLHIFEQGANGSLEEIKRMKISFWHVGINFGGYVMERTQMISLKKGTLVGLRCKDQNLSDVMHISEQNTSIQSTVNLYNYRLGDMELVATNKSLVLPFRIWTLPKSVGRLEVFFVQCETGCGALILPCFSSAEVETKMDIFGLDSFSLSM
jgi:hypothetical protein